ncbi:LLM class F420-dependent oxidoreductase [Nocardia carnea]|uniref:LLM class F420-dependent oxidoreductase n=1 Tax=Nocardia carnea TaxID=37328 RepID=UPI002454E61F|nr:LLM class F420-dependent oxidoreductase [Nocardia carnea]
MHIGISSPIVIAHPSMCADWERDAGIAELARIAETADRLGFHHLTCSEHVAVPVDSAAERGGTYWDPLATFGFLAARTSGIRLATQVLVLGYHHPLEIAKRYGTLDLVSGGRLILGLGVGSLREEFDLLGAEFAERGARADEALAALRAALSVDRPEYHGRYFDFENMLVRPHAVQPRVPLWIGGRTRRSLRRAAEFGDGWVPFGLALGEVRAMLKSVELPAGFELVLGAGQPLDPIGAPDRTAQALDRLRAAGTTIASVGLTATGAADYCDRLAALRTLATELGCTFDDRPGPPPENTPAWSR